MKSKQIWMRVKIVGSKLATVPLYRKIILEKMFYSQNEASVYLKFEGNDALMAVSHKNISILKQTNILEGDF